MRGSDELAAVRALVEEGLGASAIAHRTGIPRSTVRDWLQGRVPAPGRGRSGPLPLIELPARRYAYLLGLYLGDGYLARSGRTFQLRVFLDAAYPRVAREAADAMSAVTPSHSVAIDQRHPDRCLSVKCHWRWWPALIPQHGPGRKHLRRIALKDWQREITHDHPKQLIRGLLHSDGSRYVAVQRRHGREYRYVRYGFTNLSEDIKAIFCHHLDLLGIQWTRASSKNIAIARRSAVAKLDEFVGPKR
jgi:hypothetical protein